MIVHYFLYTLLISLMSIQQSYCFDDKHIESRTEDTIKLLNAPKVIKKRGLTEALLRYILHKEYNIRYSYDATKSGIRLVTSMEGNAPPIIEAQQDPTQPEFGYTYDEKTICRYFNYLNPNSERKFTCLCHTAMAPNELSYFLKVLMNKEHYSSN